MKKTYIIPNCKSAEMEAFELIAESNLRMMKASIENEGDILVKEQQSFDSNNIWDTEW